MKKLYSLCLLIFISAHFYGQFAEKGESGFVVASQFAISKPLTELDPVDESKIVYKEKESGDKKNRKAQEFIYTVEKDGEAYGNDKSTLQTEKGMTEGGDNKIAWAGQNATGFRPFDPSGAVGPNHYVQMINSTTFKVYDKTNGTVLLTQTLGNLWSPATANAGDPIVMYDKAADRWFLAQFGSGNNNIYIAISTTSNPLGTYYTWTFTSPAFPDYLKFAVWQDGYYMTSNQAQKVFAFERAAMLVGTPAARSVYQSYAPPQGGGFFCPMPGDAADGTLPPAGTPCPIMSFSDNGWGGANVDAVQIYNMTVNWVPTTPTAVIALAAAVPTAAFDASYESTWNNCSQPGTTQKLDAIGGIVQYRVQWKSWSGYNSVVLNWSVKISATQRSIKWVELRQSQSTGVWSVYQEGIYTPDGATRWMGSIAMDNNGSIGLSYIKSDATSIFPGLYWTGRRACDPLGTMSLTETTVVAGTGFQSGTNRVGDYAHCSLDPDGVTFWNTSEYMGGPSGGSAARTQVFSYQIPTCTPDAIVNITLTSGSNPSCAGNNMTFTASPFNGGTTPIYQWKLNGVNVGTDSPTYSTSAITNGQTVSCVMTSNLPGATNNPATSNSIVVTVNSSVSASVAIALTGGSNPTCPGSAVTFTATPTNGGTTPFYQWQINGVNAGSNSPTFISSSITNGQVVTCLMTSNAACPSPTIATSNGITMTVTILSPAVSIAQTSGTNPTCAGISTTFTATVTNGSAPAYQWQVDGGSVGTNSPTYATTSLSNGQIVSCSVTSTSACPLVATLGTGVLLNPVTGSTASLAAAYPTYWGNGRQQYLILASELTALGLSAGSINSVAFNINGTVGNPATLNGYTIKMAATAAPVLTTTFQAPTFTTVFGPTNYTPITNSWNTHDFSSAFNWNGTSNVLVDICFSNQVVGVTAYQSYQSTTSFVASSYYQADGSAGAGACATTTGVTGSRRPNMVFAAAPAPVVSNSNNIAMTVNANVTPAVAIALTSGSNPGCAGSSLTFTATPTNGGATPAYQWKVNGANAGTNSATFTTSSLTNAQVVTCVMTSNATCPSPTTATSNGITVTVNSTVVPAVSIALTSGSNPTCSGSSLTFTATPTNGGTTPAYQWKVAGVNAGTNSATFTTSSITNGQIVTCVLTSNAACASPTTATSAGITVNVNATLVPAISIALTAGTNPTCSGSSLTFTATPTNGGTTPSYQWKVAGVNAGTNSPTFTTSSITNGQIVTCVMTSNAVCANPSTATSSGITVTVNATLAPAVSIALTAGANPSCSGSSLTFTATPTNGGTTPSYQWKVAGLNAGTNSATFTTSSITNGQIVTCVLTSNAACASPTIATSAGITVNVNATLVPAISIALTAGANPSCSGSSLTFTATPTNGGTTPAYQWKVAGVNAGTNSPTFTTSSITNGQIVTCVLTSNAACASPTTATSSGITIVINATSAWYADTDGDGYGNIASTLSSCTQPAGYVANSTDCNDAVNSIHPGVIETCNTIDDNCNGLIDEGFDEDLDGYSICNGDCDDNNGAVNPGATDICNGVDDNCNNAIDEGCCNISASAIATNASCAAVADGAVNLTVLNGAAPVTYLWSNSSTTEDLSGVVIGNYSVVATDNNGCVANANAIVANAGGAAPLAATSIGGPAGVCRNSTGNIFSVDPIAGATSYLWTLPTGATGTSTSNTISLSFSSTYVTGNICVNAVNICGQSAQFCRSIVAYLAIPAVPAAILGPNTNVCAGTSQLYSVNLVSNATSYTWTAPTNASITSGQGTASVTVTFAANYGASGVLSVKSVNCFGVSANRSMTIINKPATPGVISGPSNTVCAGTSQNYSVVAVAGANSYIWTVPVGAVINSGSTTNAINVTFPATFISGVITVKAASNCGISAARSMNVYSVPAISGVISGTSSNLCGGGIYTYSISATAGATSYIWTLPAGCTMVTNNGASVTISIPSSFVSGSICVSGINSCGTGIAKCLTLTSKPPTPASITGVATVCAGQTSITYTTALIAPYTYTWTVPATCTIVSGQGTNTVVVNWGSVTGSISVKANNACGSSSNRTKTVTVVACMQGASDEGAVLRNAEENIPLSIYPNPNDGQFTIKSDVEGAYDLINELGQVVKSFRLNSDNNFNITISGLSSGFYYVTGRNDRGAVNQKIIVTNK